jgi:glycosyltransferase involved in cell wall biosynthesis
VASNERKIERVKSSNNLHEIYIHYSKTSSRFSAINTMASFIQLKRVFSEEVKAIALEIQADIIHQHIAFPLGNFSGSLAKQLKIPFVISEQWSGYLPEDNSYEHFVSKYFIRKAFALANTATAVSGVLAKAIASKGLIKNVEVIPNVIDPVFLNATLSAHHNRVPQIVHVSSLNDREKNISCLIKALKLVKEEGQAFHCTIVGDSHERSSFERMSKENLLQNHITFVGAKSPQELLTIYQASDFFLLTSNYETFGVVIVEALACGLPVVASAAGAIPELVNHQNGLLFSTGNAAQAKLAICQMLQSYQNYSRFDIQEPVSEQFSMEHIANKFSQLYLKLIHE